MRTKTYPENIFHLDSTIMINDMNILTTYLRHLLQKKRKKSQAQIAKTTSCCSQQL